MLLETVSKLLFVKCDTGDPAVDPLVDPLGDPQLTLWVTYG
ncbi:19637_t:CDS:2 [Cetraspora pellucida]|uniref:19637_t:CDS:1 n=1 Tax=Cetraspora pellucida TaxID=1433469 RepID=A0A9N9DSU9_9GLOM|nr:19637_t:CDS:2 [Cetraspora pellucida]